MIIGYKTWSYNRDQRVHKVHSLHISWRMCSILFNEKKGMKVIIGIEMQIFKDNGGVSNYSIFLRMEFVNEQRLGPHFSGHFTKRKQLYSSSTEAKTAWMEKMQFSWGTHQVWSLLAPFCLQPHPHSLAWCYIFEAFFAFFSDINKTDIW